VFADVPLCDPHVDSSGFASVAQRRTTALLITENCQLDKRTNSGKLRPGQKLQFVPLGNIDDLGPDRRTRLLDGDINPPEAVYAGEVEGQHLAGLLSALYPLPAADLGCEPKDFAGHGDLEEDDSTWRLTVPDDRWVRLITMDPQHISVMYKKMALFWTGTELTEDPAAAN
jgi:hypothetical protein